MRNHEVGQIGEDAAAQYLEKKGLKILQRNYRTRLGEIDLIAQEDQTIAFVEVKTRSSDCFGSGAESVGEKRLKRLHRAGQLFLAKHFREEPPFRIDVISLRLTPNGGTSDVEHYVNVTL